MEGSILIQLEPYFLVLVKCQGPISGCFTMPCYAFLCLSGFSCCQRSCTHLGSHQWSWSYLLHHCWSVVSERNFQFFGSLILWIPSVLTVFKMRCQLDFHQHFWLHLQYSPAFFDDDVFLDVLQGFQCRQQLAASSNCSIWPLGKHWWKAPLLFVGGPRFEFHSWPKRQQSLWSCLGSTKGSTMAV